MIRQVLVAKIICSDGDCEEEREIAIDELDELDGLVCDCGFGFVLAQIHEISEPGGKVLSIAKRRRRPAGPKRPLPKRRAA